MAKAIIGVLKKTVLGMGLALGLAQIASAQTYTGTYSGADNGNITITIDQNGAVSCNLSSAAGRGSFTGTGGVIQQTPSLVFNCSHDNFPNYLQVSGDNVRNKDTLSGQFGLAPTIDSKLLQGNFTANLSTGGGGGGGASNQLSAPGISGLWYDPASNGTGFNLIAAENGFFATYYGRNAAGGPLWLISTEVPTGTLKTNTQYTTILGATTAGTFSKPAYAVETWGQLDITFQSCNRATATLSGKDGTQKLNLQRLTTITGAGGC